MQPLFASAYVLADKPEYVSYVVSLVDDKEAVLTKV